MPAYVKDFLFFFDLTLILSGYCKHIAGIPPFFIIDRNFRFNEIYNVYMQKISHFMRDRKTNNKSVLHYILFFCKKLPKLVDNKKSFCYNGLALKKTNPRGCNSMVEFQPSKLAAWVRFPSPAPLKYAKAYMHL